MMPLLIISGVRVITPCISFTGVCQVFTTHDYYYYYYYEYYFSS